MQLLKRVELKGYKSIKDQNLDLAPLNVFIGANGSGKSNLVSFFKMLNHMMAGNLQAFIGESGGANSLLYYGAKATPQLEATLHFELENADNAYHLRLGHAAMDTLIFQEERISYHLRNDKGPPFVRVLDAGHRETRLVQQPGEVAQVMPGATEAVRKSVGVFRHILSQCRVFQFHDTSATARIRLNVEIDQNRYLMSDGGNLAAML